jgi:hypothetical protein
MKTFKRSLLCFIISIMLIITCGCIRHYDTIERTVNAVWSADNTQILKIVSTYETYKPSEKYYYARASRNWRYRFETCNPDISDCEVVGSSADIDQRGILEHTPVYWLPAVQKIVTFNPHNRAVLKDLTGLEQSLEPPSDVMNRIFARTNGSQEAIDIAPSPDEDVIAVYFQSALLAGNNLLDFSYIQCISFFNVTNGSHISTLEVPLGKTDPALNVYSDYHLRRCHFLWSGDGSGVYVVTRTKAFLLRYGSNSVIEEVDLVPERGLITNSGSISNSGQQLLINIDGNSTSLEILQIDDWKPFGSLGLIPKASNTYSFW